MTTPNFELWGRQMHAAIDAIVIHGPDAWKRTKECNSPLRSSNGTRGPVGDHADPTAAFAMHPDPDVDAFPKFRQALDLGFDNVKDAAQLATRYGANMAANERAGIGSCTRCSRYCDGVKNNRLRTHSSKTEAECPACYARTLREVEKTA